MVGIVPPSLCPQVVWCHWGRLSHYGIWSVKAGCQGLCIVVIPCSPLTDVKLRGTGQEIGTRIANFLSTDYL